MSDVPPGPPPQEPAGPPGPGWWLASDGRYYPPEQAPGTSAPPPPPPAYMPYTPYAPGIAQAASTNGLAIASLVLGILWLWWIGTILALVFGYVAKGQIDRSAGRQSGRGMAIAGIVLGWIGVAGLVVTIVFFAAFADEIDEIDSDPPDGFCDEDRFLQDPDC